MVFVLMILAAATKCRSSLRSPHMSIAVSASGSHDELERPIFTLCFEGEARDSKELEIFDKSPEGGTLGGDLIDCVEGR